MRLQEKGKILREAPGNSSADDREAITAANVDKFVFTRYERRLAAQLRQEAGLKVAHRFKDYNPQSLAFTLWWQNSLPDGSPAPNTRRDSPAYSALRVRVQAVSHVDHVTISFFIDAEKPYGNPPIYSVAPGTKAPDFGHRRARIASHLDHIRRISDGQLRQGSVERDRLPEKGISAQDAKMLQESADYLYEGIWHDFMSSFDIGLDGGRIGRIVVDPDFSKKQSEGEIFMDHRGLVISVPGLSTPLNLQREQEFESLRAGAGIGKAGDQPERSANVAVGSFPVFDHKSNEPNAVLKSYWPFLRRVIPWADYRDVIGCGIAGWRALYVNSLGASGSFYGDEESRSRGDEVPHLKTEAEGRINAKRPVTYLILTKGEPHREQIGRFVEQINTLGTSRLFALKNLRTIKNAGTHLRLLGAELDGVLEYWGDQRKDIEDEYEWKLAKLSNPKLQEVEDLEGSKQIFEKALDYGKLLAKLWGGELPAMPHMLRPLEIPSRDLQELNDERVKKLADLVKRVERRLVEIGGALDNIGNGGAGRILYVINRAKLHMNEFERLWPTLDVGDVDGWANYGRFVQVGVLPTFNLIRLTGERLVSLRQRLQGITEMIQTSALIIETEATRSNTEILRRISSNVYFLWVPISLIFSAAILPPKLTGPVDADFGTRLMLAFAAPALSYAFYRMKKKKEERDTEAEHDASRLYFQQLLRWRKRAQDDPKG